MLAEALRSYVTIRDLSFTGVLKLGLDSNTTQVVWHQTGSCPVSQLTLCCCIFLCERTLTLVMLRYYLMGPDEASQVLVSPYGTLCAQFLQAPASNQQLPASTMAQILQGATLLESQAEQTGNKDKTGTQALAVDEIASSCPASKLAGGRYEIEKKLGEGCFGQVWSGVDSETRQVVAVKFENKNANSPQLKKENDILKMLTQPRKPQGFAECFWFGAEGRFSCLVMEMLSKSLDDALGLSNGKFTPQSALLCADQILRRIEYLHSKGVVHRDIKCENFMFGIQGKIHHLYLIDFGLSKNYWHPTANNHVEFRIGQSLTGTARYASINAQKGMQQSRRDDLEAIGHMLAYFLRGSLPWSGLKSKTQASRFKEILAKKEQTSLDDLCADLPTAFKTYLQTVRGLGFQERPDYRALRKLFTETREEIGPAEDHEFQWLEGKDLGKLEPLETDGQIVQPDDKLSRSKTGFSGFCFCGGKLGTKD